MGSNLQSLSEKWGFQADGELKGGHCSRVYADRTRVLKIPFQGEELTSGYEAAFKLSGNVGPVVFAGDAETGSLLMERLDPGMKLMDSQLSDGRQVEIAARFAQSIQTLPTDKCMPLAEYVDNTDPLVSRLLETSGPPRFLHGDLHQENILLHGPDWKLIDPKGLAGDPAYEPAAFLRNPIHTIHQIPNLLNLLKSRIRKFSKLLELEPWRICAWSLTDVRSFKDPKWSGVIEVLEALEVHFRTKSRIGVHDPRSH